MVFDFLSRLTGMGNPVEAVAEQVVNVGDSVTQAVQDLPGAVCEVLPGVDAIPGADAVLGADALPFGNVAEHVGNLGDNATSFVEGIPGVYGLSETLGGLTEHVNNLGGSVTEQLSSFFKFGE